MQLIRLRNKLLTLLLPAALALSAVQYGCKGSGPIVRRKPTSEELAMKARKEIPAAIFGTEWSIHWYGRAPGARHALLPIAKARAARGNVSDPSNPTLTLQDVIATIYRDGMRSATVFAPTVEANQRDKVFYASGGVKIDSITDPPDTVITGDDMTWDTNKNLLVVSGHANAVVTHRGRKPDTTSGDRLVFDTRLKEIRNE